jgi:hypothetical protein
MAKVEEQNPEFEAMRKRAEKAESDLENLKTDMAKETDNSEVEKLRQQLKEATDKIEDFEKAQNSDAEKTKAAELQKLKDDLAEAQRINRQNEIDKAFAEKATELKAKNPAKLLALVKEKIEIGDDGKPKNLDKVFEQAKNDYAEEFGEAKKDSGTSRNGVDGGKKDESDAQYSDDMSGMERMRMAYGESEAK